MTGKRRPPGRQRTNGANVVDIQARSHGKMTRAQQVADEHAARLAQDAQEAAGQVPDIMQASIPARTEVVTWDATTKATLQVKPSQQPHLLVWVPEANAYQAIFLPVGTTWVLQTAEAATQQAPKLWIPGMPG